MFNSYNETIIVQKESCQSLLPSSPSQLMPAPQDALLSQGPGGSWHLGASGQIELISSAATALVVVTACMALTSVLLRPHFTSMKANSGSVWSEQCCRPFPLVCSVTHLIYLSYGFYLVNHYRKSFFEKVVWGYLVLWLGKAGHDKLQSWP